MDRGVAQPDVEVCRVAEGRRGIAAGAAQVRTSGKSGTHSVGKRRGVLVSTRSDRVVARLLRDALKESGVPLAVMSEELASDAGQRPEFAVFIDELDGSANYQFGAGVLPYCTVATVMPGRSGLSYGDALAAYIYDHASETLWAAFYDGTFWSNVDRERRNSEIVTVDLYADRDHLERLTRLGSKFALRDFGSTALHLAGVASGFFFGAVSFNQKAHELAAGYLLITVRGGCITRPSGESLARIPFEFNATGPIIAARKPEHCATLRNLIRST